MATKNIRTTVKTAALKQLPSGLSAADLGLAKVFIKPASEYVPARLPAGKVLHITGNAIVRTTDGLLHELHVGDVLTRGDMVLTSQNGYVQIEAPGSAAARQPFESGILALPEIDRALMELSQLSISPDAGMDGEGNLSPGFQVERIAEVVDASAFAFDPANAAGGPALPFINQAAVAPFIIGIDPVHIGTDPATGGIRINPGNIYKEPDQEHVAFQINLSTPPATDVLIHLNIVAGNGPSQASPADLQGQATPVPLEVSTDGGKTWQPVSADQALIPAGHTSLLVRTPQILDDAVYEGPETLQLVAALANQNNAPVVATATITDEEDRPKVNPVDPADNLPDGIDRIVPADPNNPDNNNPNSASWSVNSAAKLETDTSDQPGDIAYFRISLSGTAAITTTLHVQVADGSARIGSDYSNLEYWNGSGWTAFAGNAADISVPANTSALLLRTTIIGDNVAEPSEAFRITAYTDAQTAVPISRDIGIADDDAVPVANADIGWGVSNAAISGNVILKDALGSQTDTDADDGTAGLHLSSFSVTVNGVTQTATLGASGNASLTLNGIGTLLMNADGSYVFTPQAGYSGTVPQITYGISDSSNVNTAASTLDLSVVNLSVASAATGGTYAEKDEPPVQYTVKLDTALPGDTTVTLGLQGSAGLNLGTTGTATNPPDFKADAASNMQYSTDGGTTWQAVSNGTALIPAGKTELLVRTPQLNDDSVYEGPETLTLTASITTPTGNTLSASGLSTITDEEDKPKVNPTDPTDTKPDGVEIVTPTDPNNPDLNHPGDANAWNVQTGHLREADTDQTAYFRINLSGSAAIPTALHVQIADGTANLGKDYSSFEYWNGSTWVAFTNNTADIVVPPDTTALLLRSNVIGDNVAESSELFKITAYTDAQLATPISRDIGIDDDDAVPVSAITTRTVAEDSGAIVDPALRNTLVTGKIAFSDADDPGTVAITAYRIGADATLHVATDPAQPPQQVQLTDVTGNAIPGAFFYLQSNGDYGYILPADYNSTQSPALPTITYTVSDGTLVNDIASTFNLNVTPVNDAPVAKADQSQSLVEGTATNAGTSSVTGNVITGANDPRGAAAGQDTDIDSPVLTIASISSPSGGQLVSAGTPATVIGTYGALTINNDGSYTYNLDNNNLATNALNATDQVQDIFTYTVSDGNGGSKTATLAINIQGANDAPTIDITDPKVLAPLALDESGLAAGSNPSASAIVSTKTVTVTDSDTLAANLSFSLTIAGDPNNAFTLTHINDPAVLQGSVATATTDEAKLFHFDVASRKYYDVVLDNASSSNLQKTWYADINGNNQMDGGEEILRVTLAKQAESGNTLTLTYKAELLGSLYHNSDYDFSYDTVNNWSIDATSAANLVTTNNIHLVVTDGVNTITDTTNKVLTVDVADDQPRIARGGFTTGADGGYIYQWSVIQWVDLPGDGTSTKVASHMTYWVDYDTTNRTYNWGAMRYQDNPYASPTATDQIIQAGLQATNRASLGIDHPFYLDQNTDHLYIYNSLGITYDVNLKTNTFTADSPISGYLRDAFEYSMFDYDGRLVTQKQSGATNIDNSAITGSNASEPLYGVQDGELLTGKAGNDTIYGDGLDAVSYQDHGADTVIGGTGNDTMYGGSYGTPVLATFTGYAANGASVIDTLYTNTTNQYALPTGQVSMHTSDVFQWQLNDGGTVGAPATDVIMDFDISRNIAFQTDATGGFVVDPLGNKVIDPVGHGDILDLRDLLVNEHDGGTVGVPSNLSQFLEVTTTGGTTTLHVSSTGQFTGSNTGSVEDQTIVLQNVDLHNLPGLSTASASADIIQALINQNRLVVDH